MPIEWRDIPGYEGFYKASSSGEILRIKTGKILTGHLHGGYRRVRLFLEDGDKYIRLHKLIALTFLGTMPSNCTLVRHLDDVRTNNAASNLAYGTEADNSKDATENWLAKGKSRPTGNKRLTDDEVLEAKKVRADTDITWIELGRRYGVHHKTIASAVKGRTFKHLLSQVTKE